MRLMGGVISLNSVPGKGSTFRFEIPLDWKVKLTRRLQEKSAIHAWVILRPILLAIYVRLYML